MINTHQKKYEASDLDTFWTMLVTASFIDRVFSEFDVGISGIKLLFRFAREPFVGLCNHIFIEYPRRSVQA